MNQQDYPSSGTNSASLAKAEREIKALKAENEKLKSDLSDISSLYKLLVDEQSHEKFDERRVNFLKSQLVQVERQTLLLNEALSSRIHTILDVENGLTSIADICRANLQAEGAIGEVKVNRADLKQVLDTAESCRIKLSKNVENTSHERLQRPLTFMRGFVKESLEGEVSLLDVCSGQLDHLNLKHVAQLESRLSLLYKELIGTHQILVPLTSVDPDHGTEFNREVPTAVYDRLATHLVTAARQLQQATADLLQLSVLVPSAPWGKLRKPIIQDLTTTAVMSRMSSLPRSKQADVKEVVDAAMKAFNYQSTMAQLQVKALKKELEFHSAVYQHQQEYMKSMFSILRTSCWEFNQEVYDVIAQPLEEVMVQYRHLEKTATEDALKDFLASFKLHARQIDEGITKLKPPESKADAENEELSELGTEYFQSLSEKQMAAIAERDKLLNEIEGVKQEKEEYQAVYREFFQLDKPAEEDKTSPVSDNKPPATQSEGFTPSTPSVTPSISRSSAKFVKSSTTSAYKNKSSARMSYKREMDTVISKGMKTDVSCDCGAEGDAEKAAPVRSLKYNSSNIPVDRKPKQSAPLSVRDGVSGKGTPLQRKSLSGSLNSTETPKWKSRTRLELKKPSRLPGPKTGGATSPPSKSSSTSPENPEDDVDCNNVQPAEHLKYNSPKPWK